MTDTPKTWSISGTTYRLGPGGIYAVPEPRETTLRWAVARELQEMAREATEEAIRMHRAEDIVCPECKTRAFKGMIPDGHGNTIPCWRCNILEARWAEVLRTGRYPEGGL